MGSIIERRGNTKAASVCLHLEHSHGKHFLMRKEYAELKGWFQATITDVIDDHLLLKFNELGSDYDRVFDRWSN